jgi:hypothetical protein
MGIAVVEFAVVGEKQSQRRIGDAVFDFEPVDGNGAEQITIHMRSDNGG